MSSSRIFFLLLFFSSANVSATSLDAYMANREGVQKFNQKSFYPAYQNFLKALQEDPLNPQVHMNLGRTFEENEEFEKAEKAYKGALKLIPENSSLRFEGLFNLAIVQAKQDKIDEALGSYQAALEMDPDSKEVKTNIELLMQGQGGGGKDQDKDGKGKDKEQKKEGEGDKDKDKDKKDPKQNQQDGQEPKKPQPKPFESKDLTPQDVKKILDEIKNQEQSIRAGEYERNAKDSPKGKDW